MKKATVTSTLAAGLFMLAALVAPATGQSEANGEDTEEFLTEEIYWIGLVGETDRGFTRALDKLEKAERRQAAAEIRVVAAFVLQEAKNAADDEDRRSLRLIAHELQWLANEVKAGRITDVEEIRFYFVRTDRVLAKHHRLKALAHWSKKETKAAERHLKAGARHVSNGFKWLGREMKSGAKWTGEGIEQGDERVFQVGPKAKILLGGRAARLADLKIGQTVSVLYEEVDGRNAVTHSHGLPSGAQNSVEAIAPPSSR